MKSEESNQEYDCNQNTIKDVNKKIKNRNSWTITGISILFSFVIAYKLICTDFSEIHIELSLLLSFAVAFFAIWLSVLFYFKADEASKRFYNDTYKFIKDTSIILGEIKATFGEKFNNVEKYMSKFEGSYKKDDEEKIKELENELNKIREEKKNTEKEYEKSKIELKDALEKISKNDGKKEILKKFEAVQEQFQKLKEKDSQKDELEKEKESYQKERKLPTLALKRFCRFLKTKKDGDKIIKLPYSIMLKEMEEIFNEYILTGNDENLYPYLLRRGLYNIEIRRVDDKVIPENMDRILYIYRTYFSERMEYI
ncbi:hypothetical protein HMPREF9093_00931 [Fusobacterium sp. oral taxon 370 str. F0437]|uniref:hypothetical protein n=1 Tax=Fusobacterium sp. oral taxon 370 TaxID=712288 RepID=UPI000234A6E9|nr:hypothetical protein [Fusobacterium sp. oral taxon 370]EHI78809.1 hypothetical protein HMPREF9093_00931 [Fusobacterium sp. oral taxon 370 str. F0437]